MNDMSLAAQLGDLCAISSGLTLRARLEVGSELGILTAQQGDISPAGEFDHAGATRMYAPEFSPRHLARPGDVLFRSRGPFWSAWAVSDLDEVLLAIAPLFILRPSPELDAGFLAWQIGRPAAQRYFATHAKGTGVKLITSRALAELPLQVPPLEVQHSTTALAALAKQEAELSMRGLALRRSLIGRQLDAVVAGRSAETADTPDPHTPGARALDRKTR